MKRLTDPGIERLKPKAEPVTVAGGGGLFLNVGSSGRKTWFYLYRSPVTHKLARLPLGRWPEICVRDARVAHERAKAAVEAGADPRDDQPTRATTGALSCTALAEEYLVRYAERKKKSGKDDRRLLKKEFLKRFGHRKAADLKRSDVARMVDEIEERSPSMARVTLASVRKMYNWGITRGLVEVNPCQLIKVAQSKPRERVLDAGEIRQLWKGLGAVKVSDWIKLALRLQLVTAQRVGEICAMRWDEIENDTWTIPAEKTKANRTHRVPLSRMALDLLVDAGQIREGEYVFPGKAPGTHGRPLSVAQGLRRNFGDGENKLKMEPLTPHDLRRSAATGMGRLGVSREHIKRVLNHSFNEPVDVYDHHNRDAEKRAALTAWADELSKILGGSP